MAGLRNLFLGVLLVILVVWAIVATIFAVKRNNENDLHFSNSSDLHETKVEFLEMSKENQTRLQAMLAQGEKNLNTVNSSLILCQEQKIILHDNLTALHNEILTFANVTAKVTLMQGEIESVQQTLTQTSQDLQSFKAKYAETVEATGREKQQCETRKDELQHKIQEQRSKIKDLEVKLLALSGVNRPVPVHSITALCITALLVALPVNM
ncbi:uncharacterized protein LOC121301255 [Polyodon spathula]|uniref:uncharacterized protein LOC121301255 n=1 Tax=Polyodon spathula TaxID=7913 RepID=UPI001B7E7089|nr:uncharacterized protein LOC121301255 [Polyodon spathula]